MFQGMARGKVGDVVFSRLNGQQISRVRNRNPKNPKTNAQQVQRAVMATVMQAYSAGKEIFDHSFEGRAKGSANQQRFLSLNAKSLRAAIVADLQAGLVGVACDGRVVGPGVPSFVPWRYRVSEGSLQQRAFNAEMVVTNSSLTLSEWLNGNNIQKDDIFTLVVMQSASDSSINQLFIVPGSDDVSGHQLVSRFSYLQLKVKNLANLTQEQLDDTVDEIPFSLIFDVYANAGIAYDDTTTLTEGILTGDTLPLETSLYASGVIMSRESSKLRSTCDLEYPVRIAQWTADWGISSDLLQRAWSSEIIAYSKPELILEGSNF